MNANSTRKLRWIAALAALVVAASSGVACRKPTPDETERGPSEANFARQVQAVRDGRSSQIRLDHGVVTDDDLRQLDGLEDKLLRINLSRTEITDRGLAEISRLARLEQLRLASGRIDDAGLKCLAKLEHLRFLHLIDMPITDAGLDHLHVLKSLESLYLDGTKTTDEGLGRLLTALPGVHLHVDDHHHRLDSHQADHTHPQHESGE
jgi:hypothetical protein